MGFEGFPVSGWRAREIPVHRAADTPAVLTVRSRGPLTGFVVKPVVDTPRVKKTGGYLLQTFGTAPHMFVLPGEYTHVRVERAGKEGNGVARWHLDRVAVEDLRSLQGRVTGTGAEVLTWHGDEARITFSFTEEKYGQCLLDFFSFKDGKQERVEREGDTRGTAVIPGPGFVRIQGMREWQVNVI